MVTRLRLPGGLRVGSLIVLLAAGLAVGCGTVDSDMTADGIWVGATTEELDKNAGEPESDITLLGKTERTYKGKKSGKRYHVVIEDGRVVEASSLDT